MALNFDFLGLGVSFGAHDQGLQKEQGLVNRGFLAIKDSLTGLADSNPFERIGAGVQSMTDHVSAVVNQVRGLTEGVNLTTGYEAHMQALSVESRRLGANMGYAGTQLNRFSSQAAGLADGLNISAQDAAHAIDAVARGGEGLRVVGLRTARDVARFQAAGLGNVEELSSQIHQLRTEYHMTDAQVQRTIGSTVAMGRATGDVSAAMGGLGEIMTTLRQRSALQGTELDSEELARSAAQVQSLAGGFYQMTHNADEARRMAFSILQSQQDAQQNWSNMFAGTDNDVSDFVTHMSIAQGDVNHAFEQMREGPADFVRGIVQMYRTAKQRGPVTAEQFNFLRAQLERALGPQSAQLMSNFMQNADDATLATMGNIENATTDLGRMAREAHRTGRTLQEEFQRIKDIGIASFRGIGRHEAVEMVGDTAREFHRFNDSMRDVVARGGPMAEFVEKLSAIHQIGALALIPRTLRPMAVLFGHITEGLAPLVTALGALGFNLTSLLNPYTLVVAAAGYLLLNFFELYVETHSLGAAFDKLTDRVVNFATEAGGAVARYTDLLVGFLADWSKRAYAWASTFDWGAFFTTWINRALAAVRGVSTWLHELGDSIFDGIAALFSGREASTRIGRIIQNLGGIASLMLRGIGESLSRLDWSTVAHMALFGLFDAMLGPVLGTVAAMMPWERLGGVISSGLADAMHFIQGGGLGAWMTQEFESLRATVAAEWPGIEAEIVRFARAIPGHITEAIGRGSEVANHLLVVMREGFDAARGWVVGHRDEIVEALSAVGSRVLVAVGWLVRTALGALWEYITNLPQLYENVVDLLESALHGAATAVGVFMESLVESVRGALVRAFPQYEDTINSVADTLRSFYRFAYETIYQGLIVRIFGTFRDTVVGVRDGFYALGEAASAVARFIEDPWGSLVAWFSEKWAEIAGDAGTNLHQIAGAYEWLRGQIAAGVSYLDGLFSGLGTAVQSYLGGAVDWVSQKWETFKAAVRTGIDSISGLLHSIFGGGGEVESATQDSVGATQAVANHARSIVSDTTQAVSGGIVSGLVNAFSGGFASVLRGLGSFKDRFLEMFARFGTSLRDKVLEAMEAARTGIDSMLEGIGRSLAALSSRFQSLVSTATTLAALSAATAPTPGLAAASAPIRPLDHATTPEDIRQAVHDPQWARTYVQVFDARMQQLIGAVERGNRASAGSAARRGDTGTTADSLRRSEEGIQTGR